MRNDNVSKIAYSSMFTAISVVICVIASFFSTMSLAITAFAGIISAVALVQCGYKYAALVYLASSILVILLSPNKECAVYYAVLFGHYPILRTYTERIRSNLLKWMAKLCAGNVLYVVVFLITTYILGISESVGKVEIIITAAAFNIAFVLYDICIGRIMLLYIYKRSQNRRFR